MSREKEVKAFVEDMTALIDKALEHGFLGPSEIVGLLEYHKMSVYMDSMVEIVQRGDGSDVH